MKKIDEKKDEILVSEGGVIMFAKDDIIAGFMKKYGNKFSARSKRWIEKALDLLFSKSLFSVKDLERNRLYLSIIGDDISEVSREEWNNMVDDLFRVTEATIPAFEKITSDVLELNVKVEKDALKSLSNKQHKQIKPLFPVKGARE